MLPILPTCIRKYESCWAGDIQVALCLRDIKIMIRDLPGLSTEPPDDSFHFPKNACARPISFHHVKPIQMYKVFKMETSLAIKDTFVTMSDVFHAISSDITVFGNDMDRIGKDLAALDCDNDVECEAKCWNRSDCRSWVFGETQKQCWLRDHIPNVTPRKGYKSGILSDRYICQDDIS